VVVELPETPVEVDCASVDGNGLIWTVAGRRMPDLRPQPGKILHGCCDKCIYSLDPHRGVSGNQFFAGAGVISILNRPSPLRQR